MIINIITSMKVKDEKRTSETIGGFRTICKRIIDFLLTNRDAIMGNKRDKRAICHFERL